jgi:glycosyltransferase involved in cell wall biosynthesis
MARAKLMVMSDAPTSSTGLGRITREIVQRIVDNLSDTIEVCTFGYGGCESRHLPWRQYTIRRLENWIAPELPVVWFDFAGNEPGYLLAIWNPGWLGYVADPETLPPSGLRDFLKAPPFEKWIYAPIDGVSVDGKLTESDILSGFDRVLAYTEWAAKLIGKDTPYLPHGIDKSVFYPRDAKVVRQNFIETVSGRAAKPIDPSVKIIGIAATNTARKDWGLAFDTCARLRQRGMNLGVWAHTDKFHGHWDLVEMANRFGLANRVIFTNGFLSDEVMATAYSGCDITLGIGSGEGFGYPLAESLACGTPVIHGNYAGGVEIVPKRYLVEPAAFKWDGGPYLRRRPVFHAEQWVSAVEASLVDKDGESLLDPQYYWDNLWPRWEKWLLEGVNG